MGDNKAFFEKQNDATLVEYCELLFDETGLWVSQSTVCRNILANRIIPDKSGASNYAI